MKLVFKDFAKIIVYPIIVLIIHLFIAPIGLYEKYVWLDVPMHFLGGTSIALATMILGKTMLKNKVLGKTNLFVLFVFVVSVVSLVAVFWEFFEFSIDILSNSKLQIGLEDTLGDLFMGILGGSISFWVFYPNALL